MKAWYRAIGCAAVAAMVWGAWQLGRHGQGSLNRCPADAGKAFRAGENAGLRGKRDPGEIAPDGTGAPSGVPQRASFEQLRLEIEEARLAAAGLIEENASFRKENLDLREQVRTLTDSLALEKARADRWVVAAQRQSQSAAGTVAGDVRLEPVILLNVNRERMLAVLDGGREDGIRPGMFFFVSSGDGPDARLRVVDVRGRISGALIEVFETGRFPEAGDRAIPTASGSNDR